MPIEVYYFYITSYGNQRLYGIYHSLKQCQADQQHAINTGNWEDVSAVMSTLTLGLDPNATA